jgi:mTERF domain-containing protein
MSLSAEEQTSFYSRFPNGVEGIRRLGRRRLHAWLEFFLSNDDGGGAGLDHAQLKRMVLSRPQLLSYALSNVRATTAYFREELGLSSDEYASVLRSYPSVLMHGVDSRLRPTVNFLQNECGGGRDNWTSWKRVVYSYPSIFSYSPERTLSPKVKFLCGNDDGDDAQSLGLSRSELSQVVSKFPPTLWLSEENLRSKLDFLVESLGLEGSDLRTIIVSYPQILGLSLPNNLMPKVNFFLDAEESSGDYAEAHRSIRCGLSKDQLREFVLYQPALLAYSLEKRLRPRIARMQEKNIYL